MKKLVFATGNKHKFEEVKAMLKGLEVDLIQPPEGFDPVENGNTFEENSYIKAFEAAKLMNIPAFADDTGLQVDYLGGKPGIYSSRYAPTDKLRIEKLLNELKNVPAEKRTADFTCAMTVVAPNGDTLFSAKGVCEGIIVENPTGINGFGYDPVFFIPELNKTMAELTLEEKNLVSHRAKAFKQLLEWLKKSF